MKVCVLDSGSKGNSTYYETEKLKFLVDIGPSCLYVEKSLKSIGVEPSSIDMIFLTHTHADHVNGLRVFLKKYHPKVYLSEKMYDEMDVEIDDHYFITTDFSVEDLNINLIRTSHDVAESFGYVFMSDESSVVHITDTGYINVKYFRKLKGKKLYIFESNHDVRMLREGRYPYHLQQRILSDRGHLSNKDSSYYLSEFITDDTVKIILIHLSEENNSPSLAFDTLIETLRKKSIRIPDIEIAKQKERTELIEI